MYGAMTASYKGKRIMVQAESGDMGMGFSFWV